MLDYNYIDNLPELVFEELQDPQKCRYFILFSLYLQHNN